MSLTHWQGEPLRVWAELWHSPHVEVYDVLDSTNDRARALAKQGGLPFSVVVAGSQTAGRGRRGTAWDSPAEAGLWISVLLPAQDPVPSHLPLLVGLAGVRAVQDVSPRIRMEIEWPNDLVVEGRKAGGVLCERGGGPRAAVVAGVGINVGRKAEDFPPELAGRATSLEAESEDAVALGDLATALLRQLHALCGETTEGIPSDVLRELADRDSLRDRPVWSQQAGAGTARGIDADGALLLEGVEGERVRVVAGSVRPSSLR